MTPNIWALIAQNRVLENVYPTTHVVHAQYFCNILVLFSSTTVPPLRF